MVVAAAAAAGFSAAHSVAKVLERCSGIVCAPDTSACCNFLTRHQQLIDFGGRWRKRSPTVGERRGAKAFGQVDHRLFAPAHSQKSDTRLPVKGLTPAGCTSVL